MRTFLLLIAITAFGPLYAQQEEKALELVEEGVTLHDKGEYAKALVKYDKALEYDADNLNALAEKAFTYTEMKKFEEAILCCQRAIEKHPGDKGLRYVYVTYGNAADALKDVDKSLKVYDEGIKQFPDFYHLYYNKAVTLMGDKQYEEAIVCLQESAALNPEHASSHNSIARVMAYQNKRIPALMAYWRCLVVEPEGARAQENLVNMRELLTSGAKKTGKNAITIEFNPDMVDSTKENNFAMVELMMTMTSGLNLDEMVTGSKKKKTEVEQFITSFEMVSSSLKEGQEKGTGYFWKYYAPYFIALKDNNHTETFAYLIFASSGDKKVTKWLEGHITELSQFYKWSKDFKWSAE